MSQIVDRVEVRRMLANESVQLVDVLPCQEYESEHIAGARSIPLGELAANAHLLDRELPVIVYCNDFQ